MMKPTTQELIAALALMFMGGIALTLVFRVAPVGNHDYLLIILGALGGAMGVTGGAKVANAVSTTGAGTAVNTTAEPAVVKSPLE